MSKVTAPSGESQDKKNISLKDFFHLDVWIQNKEETEKPFCAKAKSQKETLVGQEMSPVVDVINFDPLIL